MKGTASPGLTHRVVTYEEQTGECGWRSVTPRCCTHANYLIAGRLKLEGAKPKEAVGLELALKDGADGGGQLQKAEYKGYRAEGPSTGKAKQLGRLTIH